MHGREDEIVPIEQSIKLNKLINNSKLEIFENCDHRFNGDSHFENMIV